MRLLRITGFTIAAIGLVMLGSFLPWRALAENLAGYDGSVYTPLRIASLTNFPASSGGSATVSAGALLAENGGRVGAASAPATGSAASATVAANATARHVFGQVCWSATANAAVAAANVQVSIRDGASGAGNQLALFNVAAQVAAGAGVQSVAPFCTPPLGLVGTTNTAMTAEFTAGVANLNEAIFFTYFNVQ